MTDTPDLLLETPDSGEDGALNPIDALRVRARIVFDRIRCANRVLETRNLVIA